MIILGVDPGASGAVAVLPVDSFWRVKAPASAVKFANLTERQIADLFWKIYVDSNNAGDEVVAILELVHAMPAVKQWRDKDGQLQTKIMQGSVGTFKFGQSFGFLRGCLVTIGIPFEEARPQAWQKLLGCMTRGEKNVSKRKAQQLFPQLTITHATADSLCLAEYGRRVKAGGPLFAGNPTNRNGAAMGDGPSITT